MIQYLLRVMNAVNALARRTYCTVDQYINTVQLLISDRGLQFC